MADDRLIVALDVSTMDAMKEEIRNLIEPLAVNGEITNCTVDKVAWVTWSVK